MPEHDKNQQHANAIATVAAEEASQAAVAIADPAAVPDGGYGWICVGCVFVLNAFTWGVAASYGVFLAHYLTFAVYANASALDYAFIGGLQFGIAVGLASPITVITRYHGMHLPMCVGVVVQTAGYVLASFTRTIWQLYLTQGVLVGLGLGTLYIPSIAITSQWFDRRRSLANGITSAGSGIGGLIFSFATQAMINNISLPWALRIIGIVSGVMNVAATALIRSRNEVIRPTMSGFDSKLLKRQSVVLLLAWAFVSMLGYMALLYSLSDYAKSIGLSDSKAAAVTAFLNLGTAVGRPLIGLMSDRFGRIEVAGLSTFACAVFIFAIWIPSNSYGVIILFALLSGAILGVFWMTISPLCVEVAGLKDLNSLLALSWGTVILPVTFSEVVALEIRRPNADRPYLYPQLYCGLAYLLASAIMLRLWYVKRRGHER
ncbi:major facilitator superfamily protein [Saccharata proteae CBS 121410]|uniref:Major facilitator superfamily protein n=1 Tax=Saccharata proteae CBS 121410 TaxID=1314787 RepID=A0A9P4HXU9_9PEZI|nr:major facilitator superfamily protein [Saccharata proteae CBS 121410]